PEVVTRDDQGRVTVRATRIDRPILLDGRLDDAPYQSVKVISGFVQQEPLENQPSSEQTEAWILFDDQTLFITLRNWDSQPERMIMNELRKDSSNLIQNEHVVITLDTFGDKRNGFLFLVNALGGMLEEAFFDERNPSRDWNTVWNAVATRFGEGWIVEVAIPFKSLRYTPGADQSWGIQIGRVIRHKNERAWLTPVPRAFGNAVFRVSAAATLVGLETPPLARNLEIKPYAITGLTTDRTVTPNVTNDGTGDVGVDLKLGLTRSLTGDLTVNTDFAQVEEDEQQVNLTRFNLFFPEKREFFLEGQGIFNFGGRSPTAASDTPIMFFSRQIGIASGKPVPIIAGGRTTGRIGDFNVGVVNIQTDDLQSGTVSARTTNFTVARIRRDILRRSNVGVLFANRSESIAANGSNQTFGVDAVLSLFQNVRFNTYLARTATPGKSGNDLSYRTEYDYTVDRYGLNLEYLTVGSNFNPEVGFLRRQDFDRSAASVRFSPRPRQQQTIRKFYYEGSYSYLTTGTTGRLESRTAGAAFRIEFQNSDRINLETSRVYELLVRPFPIATGVPPGAIIPVGAYGWQQTVVSYQLGTQRRFNGTVSVGTGTFYNGDQRSASYRGRISVATHLSLEPQVAINWVDLPQGSFTTTLVSTRATMPLTPRMYVSALLQYNSTNTSFSSNIRFRWEYQPGSELFVVYSEGRNTSLDGFPSLDTRGLVVKFNRLFRL
ncbi:MAG: DUF5916 domain-containing protein, partial [Vicinamibacterales bacterium]